jgi:class 3 adenylate cyclase
MGSSTRTVCFTDLKGSSNKTKELGHAAYRQVIEGHLAAGMALTKRFRGVYVKNVGDMHVSTFENAVDALKYAATLQEFCRPQPCLSLEPLPVRIGLHLGTVMDDVVTGNASSDVFGVAVNKGARIEGAAEPGQVLVTGDVLKFVADELGPDAVAQFFQSAGKRELKDVGEIELQELDCASFVAAHTDTGMAPLILRQMHDAGIHTVAATATDLASPGLALWPISPRVIVTAIHRAQAEVAAMLAALGWRLRIVITDCGSSEHIDPELIPRFVKLLTGYLNYRGFKDVGVVQLSSVYDAGDAGFATALKLFTETVSKLSYIQLLEMNRKDYDTEEIEREIADAPALRFIRPALITAAALQIAEVEQHKTIVIAGADEQKQWEIAADMPKNRDRLGVLLIPVLRDDDANMAKQAKQLPSWPIWETQNSLRDALVTGNVARWVYRLLVFLPAFPGEAVQMGDSIVTPHDWVDDFKLPDSFDTAALANAAWSKLNPEH